MPCLSFGRLRAANPPYKSPIHRTQVDPASMILASIFTLKLQPISGAAPMSTSSDRKITANRANASHSTGPRSSAGKAKSRLNALKHGLRAEQVVIPGEDPLAFEAECAAWAADWQPRSHTRAILVERAAATSWRLRRCVRIE